MNARAIKNRQNSIKNTKQMTKAMEMVSAAKMRKAQRTAFAARPYAQKAIDILSRLEGGEEIKNVFLAGRPNSKRVLLLVVASDKGLIGGFNTNIIRETMRLMHTYIERGDGVDVMLVGEKGRAALQGLKANIVKAYKGAGDYAELSEVEEIAEFVKQHFEQKEIREVVAIYTEFVSTLKQRVVSRRVLPIDKSILENLLESITPQEGRYSDEKLPERPQQTSEYVYEPTQEALFASLIPSLLNIYVYHIILESNASEHSARMIAMKNASDSAEKLLHELTLFYNKARQAAITAEINEISAGVEALAEANK